MKALLSFLLLLLAAVANAVSSRGNRVLALFDEETEKDQYSQFLADLKGW